MRSLRRLVAGTVAAATLLATAVVGGALPAQAAVTNDTTVQAWYRTFLDRDPDAARTDPGRFYWVGQLDAGRRPSDVVWDLLHSAEYANIEVSASYQSYLGRAPDAGAGYWIDSVSRNGMALEWVDQNLLASNEYYASNSYFGGDAEYVIRNWYYDILDRYTISDGEISYWEGQLRTRSRLDVVRSLWYSDEAVRGRIDDNYSQVLIRDADFAGVSYWYGKEVESDINVKTLLAVTPEFSQRRVY